MTQDDIADMEKVQDRVDDLLDDVDKDAEREPDTSKHEKRVREQCDGDVCLPDTEDVDPGNIPDPELEVDLDE